MENEAPHLESFESNSDKQAVETSKSTLSAQPDVLFGIEHVIEREEPFMAETSHINNQLIHTDTDHGQFNVVKNEEESSLSTFKPGPFLGVPDDKSSEKSLSPNSESTPSTKSQSSPSFESIYDKYRSKETDTDDERASNININQQVMQNFQSSDAKEMILDTGVFQEFNPNITSLEDGAGLEANGPVVYEPPEVSSEDLDEMLENLDSSVSNESSNNNIYEQNDHDIVGGARPKDRSVMSIVAENVCNDSSEPILASVLHDNGIEKKPDLVIVGNTEDDKSDTSNKDSSKLPNEPPPYSEMDPRNSDEETKQNMNVEKIDRPSSLDLAASATSYSDINVNNVKSNDLETNSQFNIKDITGDEENIYATTLPSSHTAYLQSTFIMLRKDCTICHQHQVEGFYIPSG